MTSKKKQKQNTVIESKLAETGLRIKEEFARIASNNAEPETVAIVLRSWISDLLHAGKLKTQMERNLNPDAQPATPATLAQNFIVSVLGEKDLQKAQKLWRESNWSEAKRKASGLSYEANAISVRSPITEAYGFSWSLKMARDEILQHLENAGFQDKEAALKALNSEDFRVCDNHLRDELPFKPKGSFPLSYVEECLKLEA